jgi:peptide/nickel transport system ATP-binding protein
MADLQVQKRLTYIFITHNLSVVKHISDHILVMYSGCMVETCPSEDLFETPLHPYTKGLLSAIPIPALRAGRGRELLMGEASSHVDPPPGCRFAGRCKYARNLCRGETPAVEEIVPGHFAACHFVRDINRI